MFVCLCVCLFICLLACLLRCLWNTSLSAVLCIRLSTVYLSVDVPRPSNEWGGAVRRAMATPMANRTLNREGNDMYGIRGTSQGLRRNVLRLQLFVFVSVCFFLYSSIRLSIYAGIDFCIRSYFYLYMQLYTYLFAQSGPVRIYIGPMKV